MYWETHRIPQCSCTTFLSHYAQVKVLRFYKQNAIQTTQENERNVNLIFHSHILCSKTV